MTGPEHYKEAARLLDGVDEMANDLSEGEEPTADHFVALAAMATIAQAHATLALAAATALAHDRMMPDRDGEGWRAAAGTPNPKAVPDAG